MEQFIDFIQDRWLLIVVALVGIVIVVKIIKNMIKWLIIIAIVAALIIYGSNYIPIQ
ncbi:MAG: hypothetical protein WD424_04295 [Paenibacillaceae bacterium]